MRRTWKSLLALVCVAAAGSWAGCQKPQAPPPQAPPPVTVRHPAEEMVADSVDLTGTVWPSKTVDLVARVQGYLRSVDFTDGSWVEAGKLLFVIEPNSYEEQVRLAQAALVQSQSEYERQLGLVKENATSTANVEKCLSQRDQDAAQLELAKLNLSYTRVVAPFAGRIGRRLVDPGNLVGPTVNTKLATLDQIVPVYVYFNLNERDLLEIRAALREHGLMPDSNSIKVPVFIGLQNERGYPHEGIIDYSDTGVSTSTGTIQVRATLANRDRLFLPGYFTRIRIPLGEAQPMPVVPGAAFGNDQEGDYLLVVEAGDVVARRAVVKGPQTAGDWAVRSGVTAADRVIVNGMMSAKPGATVTIVPQSATSPAAATAPAK